MLFKWRNHHRKQFVNDSEIIWDDHLKFIDRYFRPGNDEHWYIAEHDGYPVGSIAIYNLFHDGSREWGRILVAPGLQGEGYGRKMMTLCTQKAIELGIESLRATVLADNAVSLYLHRKMGFQTVKFRRDGDRAFFDLSLDLKPLNVLKPFYRSEEILAEIEECLEVGWTGLGYKTEKFESAWKAYTGFDNAHMTNSATAGLHTAVSVLKNHYDWWLPGDEIITTPLTFVSTNHVILYEHLVPVFVDVDESLCLDVADVSRKISPNTKAIMYVGMGGNPANLQRIQELAYAHDLKLIVDAAHMAGAWMPDGTHAGIGADATVFSFHSVKNLPTADSGMVCFKNAELDRIARKMTWLGISKDTYSRSQSAAGYRWRYDVPHVGQKYHGNSIMASMGLVGLKYLERDNEHRRRLADEYSKSILERNINVDLVPIGKGCKSSRHLYQIMVDNRDEIMLGLNKYGIFPGVHYDDNTKYPMYEGDCPMARKISERLISLPLHLHMDTADVHRVCAVLEELV